MHGCNRCGTMARIARSLILFAAIPLAIPLSAPSRVEAQPQTYKEPRWYAAVSRESKVFPVLLPGDGRWLNWRDTYGAPRMRLINGTWKQVGVHQGIDIFAEKGSPVVSISSGRVENVGWTFYSGWRVGVRGTDGRYYFYAHLTSDFAEGVVSGARVEPGKLLGYMGNSGYGPQGTEDEFAPHLHFGLQSSSGWENPNQMLVDLYRTSVDRIRETKLEMRQLEQRLAELQAAAGLPSPPSIESVLEEASAIEREIARLHQSLYAQK